ncbi:hypothetical protein P692DRAFT_20387171 [Suillus brevipes Sb2]|nr:hypothetical protein P692DRAFT_20387171 [Suillus brevipes Sb2]
MVSCLLYWISHYTAWTFIHFVSAHMSLHSIEGCMLFKRPRLSAKIARCSCALLAAVLLSQQILVGPSHMLLEHKYIQHWYTVISHSSHGYEKYRWIISYPTQ